MKRLFFAAIVLMACVSSLWAQKNLPPLDQLARINDSIIAEGHNLYFSEKINWVATDYLFEKYTEEDVGGSLTSFQDSLFSCIFCDKKMENCILELRWRVTNDGIQEMKIDSPRALTQKEKDEIERKNRLVLKIFEFYSDSIASIQPEYGQLNFDFLPVNENITRVYILQGITLEGILPWGNDYGIDIDKNENIVRFWKYHRSFIPVQIEAGKEGIPMHSHLEDNPFITPTDICNFLLYGRDIYKMNSFVVLSNAFNCSFMYMDSSKTIVTTQH